MARLISQSGMSSRFFFREEGLIPGVTARVAVPGRQRGGSTAASGNKMRDPPTSPTKGAPASRLGLKKCDPSKTGVVHVVCSWNHARGR